MFVLEVNNQTQIKVNKKWLEGVIKISQKALNIRKNQEISLAFVTPAAIKKMNLAYRGKNEVTDVLSFEGDPADSGASGGEIVICLSRAKQQAKKTGLSMKNEVAKLLIHGYLHLLGYDHARLKDAKRMEALESNILTYV